MELENLRLGLVTCASSRQVTLSDMEIAKIYGFYAVKAEWWTSMVAEEGLDSVSGL
jgi:hypothetical protein